MRVIGALLSVCVNTYSLILYPENTGILLIGSINCKCHSCFAMAIKLLTHLSELVKLTDKLSSSLEDIKTNVNVQRGLVCLAPHRALGPLRHLPTDLEHHNNTENKHGDVREARPL